MSTLTEILNNPEEHYPGNFDTPQRANALLTGARVSRVRAQTIGK